MNPKNMPITACPVYQIIEKLSKKWTMHLLRALYEKEKLRFTDFQKEIPDISTRMLSLRLSELEEEGLIQREVLNEKPVTVLYSVSKKGEDLKRVFMDIYEWTKSWGK